LPLKVLHSSDWHLGAVLHGEDRNSEHRRFLAWLIDTVSEEKIDALVIAGDIFDVYAPPASSQKLYYQFLADIIKLEKAPEIFIIAGNHDSPYFLGAPAGILSHLKIHIVSSLDSEKPEDVIFGIKDKNDGTAIQICAVPFIREKDLKAPAQYNEAAAAFYHDVYAIAGAKNDGNTHVLMTGHFYLDGSKKSDDYSERTREVGNLQGLPAALLPRASYFALGHLHQSQCLKDREYFRYSGSPLPMSFSEAANEKSVVIAEFNNNYAENPRLTVKTIPLWQELRQLKGSPDSILDSLREIKAGGKNVWLAIQVSEYDGDLSAFWEELDEPGEQSAYKILVKQDVRSKQGTDDWRGDEGGELSSLEPPDVFNNFLTEAQVDAEEKKIFGALFNEIYNSILVDEDNE
jgi:exonuclease SbcD